MVSELGERCLLQQQQQQNQAAKMFQSSNFWKTCTACCIHLQIYVNCESKILHQNYCRKKTNLLVSLLADLQPSLVIQNRQRKYLFCSMHNNNVIELSSFCLWTSDKINTWEISGVEFLLSIRAPILNGLVTPPLSPQKSGSVGRKKKIPPPENRKVAVWVWINDTWSCSKLPCCFLQYFKCVAFTCWPRRMVVNKDSTQATSVSRNILILKVRSQF